MPPLLFIHLLKKDVSGFCLTRIRSQGLKNQGNPDMQKAACMIICFLIT